MNLSDWTLSTIWYQAWKNHCKSHCSAGAMLANMQYVTFLAQEMVKRHG